MPIFSEVYCDSKGWYQLGRNLQHPFLIKQHVIRLIKLSKSGHYTHVFKAFGPAAILCAKGGMAESLHAGR